jgi:hypothetical protein
MFTESYVYILKYWNNEDSFEGGTMVLNSGRFFKLLLCGMAGLGLASCVSAPVLEEQPAPFGANACLESAIVGTWKASSPADDTLTFSPDCTGVSVVCRSRFVFPPNLGKAGLVNIQVLESEGPKECLSKGLHRCSVSLMTNSAAFNCGQGAVNLTRL